MIRMKKQYFQFEATIPYFHLKCNLNYNIFYRKTMCEPPSKEKIYDQVPQKIKSMKERLSRIVSKAENLKNTFAEDQKKCHQEETNELLRHILDRIQNIHEEVKDQTQLRFKCITAPLPEFHEHEQQKQKQKKISVWLGQLCKKVFSVGFSMLKNGQLEVNKVKAYCSQNIIRNVIKLSQKNNLTWNNIRGINSCLQKQLLPYFCFKYPQTQEKQTSKKFSSILIQRDNINDNANDLLSKSSIQFQYEKDGNYNSQIMRFLNFIIRLPGSFPNKIESMQKFEDFTYFQSFAKDVENIFSKVEVEENKINMLKFDPYHSHKHIETIALEKSEKEKQDYLQKVKSYTSYQIGQKLSQNFEQFTEYQIKTGNLRLKNSAIMRIVTKWCEQLEKNFDEREILQREIPFKMKNKAQKYLNHKQMRILNALLQKQKQIIAKKLQEISNHNYEQQSIFTKKKVPQHLEMFSEEEAVVGQFAGTMFKINENYLINYLNLLIHGICKAQNNFYLIVKNLQSNKKFENEDFQLLKEEIQRIFLQDNDSFQSYETFPKIVPELITFKIGDLLRCKCTSKQTEIIALYKQIQRINHQNPQIIKILRVKNKLDSGNKDILMNLLYRGKIIVQMQLAIKSQKTKFIQCSNQFNHYFYELKRAQFGPILEMCSIWITNDMRSAFYLQSIENNNLRLNKQQELKEEQNCCENVNNTQIMRFSFECTSCKFFYFDCGFSEKHIFCSVCRKFTCFLCQFQEGNKQYKKKLFSEFDSSDIEYIFDEKPLKQLPQQNGILINLKQKKRQIVKFWVFYENNFYFMLKKDEKDQYQLIQRFKTKKLPPSFTKKYLIFNPNKESDFSFYQSDKKKYFTQNLLGGCWKSYKNSLAIINKNLENYEFQKNTHVLNSVQKLNLSQNNLDRIQNLPDRFPNVTLLLLNSNQIYKIQQNVSNFKKLTHLHLQNNIIQNIENILQLTTLTELNLSNNQIQTVPQTINNLKYLQSLNLSHNFIPDLPQEIGDLTLLQKLQLYDNYLKQLPDEFCKLSSLTHLVISGNFLNKLPQQFGQLKNLQILNMEYNSSLEELPQSFGCLHSLKTLYAEDSEDLRTFYRQKQNLKSILNINIFTRDQDVYPKIQTYYFQDFDRITALSRFTLIFQNDNGEYSKVLNKRIFRALISKQFETIIEKISNKTISTRIFIGAVGQKKRKKVEVSCYESQIS